MKFDEELPPPGEPRISESTSADWGDRLPLGIYSANVLHRDFAFRPYKSSIERELDALRRKNKAISNVAWGSMVLATMLTRVGPNDMTDKDFNERLMIVDRCWLPDVLYMLVRLRQQALGNDVRFKLTCHRCETEWDSWVNLDETELKIAETPASLTKLHTLRDGVEIAGKRYTKVVMGPARWGSLAHVTTRSPVEAEFATVAASIHRAYSDDPDALVGMFTSATLDDTTKYDFEMLRKAIEDEAPGPDLALEAECPRCGVTTHYGVDWSYDFFFKSRSL